MNTKVISAVNIKGGVGKTTTIGCLSQLLAEIGKKVLIVDKDPQANCTQLFQRYQQKGKKDINDLMLLKGNEINRENVLECIQKTDYPNIEIIAASEDLTFICNQITFDQGRSQQTILKKALSYVKEEYDFIMIDNTPFFNILTINSLCASDYVITPVGVNGFSYAGLTRLLSEINKIKDEFNQDLTFLGAFITNANKQKVVFKDLYESYKEDLQGKFMEQYIRQDKNVDESNTAFIPLLSYNRNCNAVSDYRKLLAALNILDKKDQNVIENMIKQEELEMKLKDLNSKLEEADKKIKDIKLKIKKQENKATNKDENEKLSKEQKNREMTYESIKEEQQTVLNELMESIEKQKK